MIFAAAVFPALLGALLSLAEVQDVNSSDSPTGRQPDTAKDLQFPGENHFGDLRQLTFGGQNAEAYFSHDGTELIFQATRDGLACDAIFRMGADGSNLRQVSSGEGAATCAFIAPDNRSIIYASTHLGGKPCPPKPDYSKGYVWPLYESYDIYRADPEGGNLVRLTDTPGYDAEATYSPRGDKIVFTSLRNGDLDLFMMNPDGSGVEQLTNAPGYDGGAFFSLDGKWLVWRASRPQGEALLAYQRLLAEGLVRPGKLEIYIMNIHRREPIPITDNGAANFAPYWHPDGEHVIFSSNLHDPRGRDFDLYMLNVATRALERITYYPGFDGFPMFSHDGNQLVFASNRNGRIKGETNIFITDWH